MLKKKITLIIFTVLLALLCSVGTTVAILISRSETVNNVFTIGKIDLTLTETTGGSYQLIPGKTIDKDPKIRVKGGSQDCWLFVEIGKTENFDEYVEWAIESGWTHLGGYDGIYYRSVGYSDTDTVFHVIQNDVITVREDLTEERMNTVTATPKITFKAYAIQSSGIDTPADAWHKISEEVNE